MEILGKLGFMALSIPVGILVFFIIIACWWFIKEGELSHPIGNMIILIFGAILGIVGSLIWMAFSGPLPW